MIDFFEQLYQDTEDGYMYLWTLPDRQTHWYSVTDIKKAASTALRLSTEHKDVYYGVGLTGSKKTAKQRAESHDVVAMPGVWMDLDTKDDKHPNNPEDINELIDLLNAFPIVPTIIVKSGRGVHAYWLTKELITCNTPNERQEARKLLTGFQATIQQSGQRRGWKFDSTADLSRILRVPGTMHYKSSPLPVGVIQSSGVRYNFDDLEQYAMDVPVTSREKRAENFTRLPSDRPAEYIMDNCAFVAQLKNPASMTEPQWFSAMTNLSRGIGGFDLIHELAKPFLKEKYSFEKTEKKIQHAFYDNQPYGCAYIQKAFGFTGCPSGGCGVKAPIGWATAKKKGKKKPEAETEADEFRPMEKVTDVGNSDRFVRLFGDKVRYCHSFNSWLLWDGKRYKIDDSGQIYGFAIKTIMSIYDDANKIDSSEMRNNIVSQAKKCESHGRLTALLATSEHKVAITTDEMDNDDWLLNVSNGVIDLRTGQLLPHSHTRLITKLAPVAYDSKAECPVFLKFISDVFPGKKDVIDFIQVFLGYCLTGDTSEQKMAIAWGGGGNGKGTLLNLILDVLGDYGQQTSSGTLMVKQNETISNDIARMRGARYILASETEQGKKLNETLVKQMTGQDRLMARYLRCEFFEFMPKFKLFLMTNHKPNIRGEDAAIGRRIMLIPFTQKFEGTKIDKSLSKKLRDPKEMAGILNWLVQGCLRWQKEGLNPPSEVMEATNEYRFEMDIVGQWIEDCCVTADYIFTKTSVLYQNYVDWASKNGEKAVINAKIFGKNLSARGFEPKKGTGGVRGIKGIGLATNLEDTQDGELFVSKSVDPF